MSSNPDVSSATAQSPQTTVELREVVLLDHIQLETLRSKHQMLPESGDAYSHVLSGNHQASDGVAHHPNGWGLVTNHLELVGHIGNIIFGYYLDGKRITSASARSWVVDNEYRGSSLTLLRMFWTQPNIDLLLITTANLRTSRVYAMKGAVKPPTGCYDRSAIWIIDHQKFASSLLIKKTLPLPQVLALPVGAVLSAVSWVRNIGRCHPRQHTYIREVNTIDERFDRFWEKLRAQPNRLLCVRDRAAVAWRFDRPLRAGNAWIFSYENALREFAGYAVFLRQDSPEIGLRRMRLVDFQSEGDGDKFLQDAIEVALSRCHAEGIQRIRCNGLQPVGGRLAKRFLWTASNRSK